VGALSALQLFAREGDEGRRARLQAQGEALLAAIKGLPGLSARIVHDPEEAGMPMVELALVAGTAKLDAAGLLGQLRSGRPRIELRPFRPQEGLLIAALGCLRPGDPAIIAKRLAEILRP